MSYRQNRFAHSNFIVGKKSSSTAGFGYPLGIAVAGATTTRASGVYADDAGVALGAGSYAGFESRTLLTKTIVTAASAVGAETHLRNTATQTGYGGNISGLWAYNETSGAVSVGGTTSQLFSAINAQIDVPSGATITSGKYVSAIGIGTCDLGGTHTGKAAVLQTIPCAAGAFDYFGVFYEPGSCCTIVSKSITTKGTTAYVLPCVLPNGTVGYIEVAPWT